jgi:hypothetical protein
MKYIKVIVGLGLIPLGVFVGSYINIGGATEQFSAVFLVVPCVAFYSGLDHIGQALTILTSSTRSTTT